MLLAGTQAAPGLREQRIVVKGLPAFNAGDPAFVVTRFEGWYSSVVAAPHLVPNGGGPGAIAIEAQPAEVYYTLSGSIDCGTWEVLEGIRSALLQGLVVGENAIQVLDDRAGGKRRQVFVRAYDRPDMDPFNAILPFSFPLVSPDPYKYGLEPLTAEAGGFKPEDWFRVYSEDAGDWYRTYTSAGSVSYRSYTEGEADTSALPRTALLTSDGDADSQRLTMTIQGPVSFGEWYVERVDDGSRIWADTSLAAGQSLVLDTHHRTALLNGSPVEHLVYGDFQTLRPGGNAWRLVVGSSGAGSSMSVAALPAYL